MKNFVQKSLDFTEFTDTKFTNIEDAIQAVKTFGFINVRLRLETKDGVIEWDNL